LPNHAADVGGSMRAAYDEWNLGSDDLFRFWGPMPYTILFVEDDDGVRASTEAILRNAGFRLLVASHAYEALRLLSGHKVDVLFTDIVMPDMDGVELAKRAKLLRPDLKIMFMTGYYSRAADAVRLKVGKLLYKPLREAQMVKELTSLVLRPSGTQPAAR
jgi:DNA-binding NtrC family response regulator